MRLKKMQLVIIVFILLGVNLLWAQQAQNQQPGAPSRVIELGEIKLEVRAELPQVQILDKRISPEFEEVRAEKSFVYELSGKSEILQFKPLEARKIEPIADIESLLRKNRF